MKALLLGLMAASTLATALPAAAQPVDRREMNQHRRIEQGIRSGQLNPREAYRLQMREHRVRMQEWRMRGRHGGMLNAHERMRLQHEENRNSRAIYRLKHDDRAH